jgi:imidazolonepropionase-like amidohydrolase
LPTKSASSPSDPLVVTLMRTLLTNATLVDCVHPKAVERAAVLVDDGRIREIRTDGSVPEGSDAAEIDLWGAGRRLRLRLPYCGGYSM